MSTGLYIGTSNVCRFSKWFGGLISRTESTRVFAIIILGFRTSPTWLV